MENLLRNRKAIKIRNQLKVYVKSGWLTKKIPKKIPNFFSLKHQAEENKEVKRKNFR